MRKSIPTAIAASLLSFAVISPSVLAANPQLDKQHTKASQHETRFQAELKDAWLQGKLETAL